MPTGPKGDKRLPRARGLATATGASEKVAPPKMEFKKLRETCIIGYNRAIPDSYRSQKFYCTKPLTR